jgi:hypothetical protein
MRMKHLAVAALVVFSLALPVCAQRTTSHSSGAAHSAPAVHSAPAFRGGFSASGRSQTPAVRNYSAPRSYIAPRAFQRMGAGSYGARPPYNGDLRRRRYPYRAPYGILGYGVYAYPGYLGAGYVDDSGYDGSQPAEDDGSMPEQYGDGGYEQQPDQQQLPPWPYGGAQQQAYIQPAVPAPPEEAVTLIFKDGRPAEQIHNYLLTRDTLYVDDQHRREIPVDQLDLAATVKANRAAGVDFRIPTLPGS